MKAVTKTVTVIFTLTGDGPYELEASATIMRRNFNFSGKGPKEEVPVMVKATLNQ